MSSNIKSKYEFDFIHIFLGVIFSSFLLRYFVESLFNIFPNLGIVLVIINITTLIKIFSITYHEMKLWSYI